MEQRFKKNIYIFFKIPYNLLDTAFLIRIDYVLLHPQDTGAVIKSEKDSACCSAILDNSGECLFIVAAMDVFQDISPHQVIFCFSLFLPEIVDNPYFPSFDDQITHFPSRPPPPFFPPFWGEKQKRVLGRY